MAAKTPAVLVGIDGSEHALDAASWAAVEAAREHSRLHLVIVEEDQARTVLAEKIVAEAAARCRQEAPDLDLTQEVAHGHPVEELLDRAAHARLVVLGARGRGGFTTALLGSVSSSVATHSSGPVVVVRGRPPASGPVVVGVDNSPRTEDAVRFAMEVAAQRKTELVAVQAWHEAGLLAAPLAAADREEIQQRIERSLTQYLADWRKEFPSVPLREVVQHGHPVATLMDEAREAQLLVVGHRGRGGFSGLFLGSVASGVLHHALCPVAVVRSPQH